MTRSAAAASAPLDAIAQPAAPRARLFALVRTERGQLWIILAYAGVSGLLTLAVPLAVQALVNTIAFESMMQPIIVLSLLLFVAIAFMGLLQAIQAFTVEVMQQRLFVRVATDLAYRLPRIQAEVFDQAHGPELVNRFFSVFTVQKAAGLLLMDGLSLVLQTVIGLTLLAFYHPVLFEFDLALIAAIALILFVLGRGATRTSIHESKAKFAAAAWLEEIARDPMLFKAGHAANFALQRADALALGYVEARKTHYRVVFRQLIGLLALQAVASALLLGVGGWLVVQRQLTLGQLVASEFVVAAVVAGLVKLAKHLETYYDMLASVDKLGHLVELPLERSGGAAPAASSRPAGLALTGVAYRPGGGAAVVDGLDWAIEPGARIGIVGAHGSGKSMLADMLTGLRVPSSGAVELDGVDMRDLELGALREQITCLRPGGIVAGTVLENLALGRRGVDLSHARTALEAVGLWEEVQALDAGLDTPLVPGGLPLSPQEASRLSLARAIAWQPRLIVIDEALDGLDAENRARVLDGFFRPDAPWSLVVFTRQTEVMARCDALFALARGQLTPIQPPDAKRGKAASKRTPRP
ncbi:MAG: peptidase domain-containing ABC transporter [Candidatus Sericytochromatia bacterium]